MIKAEFDLNRLNRWLAFIDGLEVANKAPLDYPLNLAFSDTVI
jgi:hypothetical protein